MLTELICRARSSLESMYFSAHGHHVNDFPNWAARRGSSRSAWLGLPQYGKTVGSRAAPHQTEPTATLLRIDTGAALGSGPACGDIGSKVNIRTVSEI